MYKILSIGESNTDVQAAFNELRTSVALFSRSPHIGFGSPKSEILLEASQLITSSSSSIAYAAETLELQRQVAALEARLAVTETINTQQFWEIAGLTHELQRTQLMVRQQADTINSLYGLLGTS